MWMWLLVPLGYLVGSISAAILVCRGLGLPDPRQQGSKNPGATNVLRYGGKKAAGLTLFGDMVKGILPVVAAKLSGADELIVGTVGVAAFLGHLYPVFFDFRGGKGVSTGAGVFFGFHWLLGAVVVGSWLVAVRITRISSLSAIIAASLAPVYGWWLLDSLPLFLATLLISVVCFSRHRLNIQRLWRGEEGRIGGS
ncbi:MAG: glycerol-3-phosphate 1-O-acyltransferase PlsY [Methylococcaceae bacterium]|nr:glycerol-3-phosphate 1-O-acyltransferase PlsY [Methylococcaceae bacterium]MCI0734481.1 glycerol-3-phosphate 1-O-acyltransferase PlsY [Methylococcaceae bacterium]